MGKLFNSTCDKCGHLICEHEHPNGLCNRCSAKEERAWISQVQGMNLFYQEELV